LLAAKASKHQKGVNGGAANVAMQFKKKRKRSLFCFVLRVESCLNFNIDCVENNRRQNDRVSARKTWEKEALADDVIFEFLAG
jgi:hypothetical protein